MTENQTWYTYRQAAQRVKRSPTTIKRWRRQGMPMTWNTQGQRIVHHHTLLTWYRNTLNRDQRHAAHIRHLTKGG